MESDEDDDSNYFEVEAILKQRKIDHEREEFLIKWKGYDESNNTWEPEDNLNCSALLAAFKNNSKEKQKAILDNNRFGAKKETSQSQTFQKNRTPPHLNNSRSLPSLKEKPVSGFMALKRSSSTILDKPTVDIDGILRTIESHKPIDNKPFKYKIPKHSHRKLAEENGKTTFVPNRQAALKSQNNIPHRNSSSVPSLQKKNSIPTVEAHADKSKMLNTSKSDQKVFKANHPKPNRKYENPPSKPNRKYENPPSKPNRKYENPPSKPEPSKNTHNKHPPVDPDQSSTNSHLETPFQKRPDKRFEDNTFDNFQKLHFQDTPVKPSSFSKQALNPTQGAHRSSSPPLPSLLGSGPLSNAHDNESTLGLYPSRSTSGSRDPKLNLKEKPHATLPPSKIEPPELLLSDVVLCKGEEIQTLVTLNTTKTCRYREEIIKLVTDQAKKPNHIHISSTIPLDVLNDLIADRQTSLLEVTFSQSLVDASKLKGFLQINEVAGIALNPKDTQQMLAFLPAADLYKLSNHKDNIGLSAHQFCAIYIQHLPLQPVRSLTYSPNPNHLSFSWEKISQLLLFPPQLKKIKSEAKFFVYGHSRIANLLSKAISRTRKITNPKAHVMMFDRGSSVLLSRTLTRHKKEPLSQLWEFGAPEKEVTRIQPPEQVFPNFSGGFVTTDIENILKNPKILDTICDQIQILNRDTVLNGHWKFVLPHTIFLQLQKAGKSYQNVQDAVIKLSLVFSSKSASALKLWSLDSQELDTVQFMEATLQNYYKTHRFFVYVDDIRSVQSERRPFCLDFVESSNIVSAFT